MVMYFVDGDTAVWRSALFVERFKELFEYSEEAKGALKDFIIKSLRYQFNSLGISDIDKPEVVICLTPKKKTFRHEIFPEYKKNRKTVDKPKYLSEVFNVVKEFNCLTIDGLEADDVLGINAKNGILVSNDKDLKTVPGEHVYNKERVSITENEANWWWMVQTLMGDRTDGYYGVPGIGPVKAMKLLLPHKGKPLEFLWDIVYKQFVIADKSSAAVINAQLSRVLRPEDYVENKVKIWFPENYYVHQEREQDTLDTN